MKRRIGAARAAVAVALVGTSPFGPPLSAADAPPLSIESFFRNSDIGAAKLSPSGKWLAITTAQPKSRIFLAVVNVEGGPIRPTVLANFNNADVNSFDWVNEDRLVFNTIDRQAPLADQRFGPGLYSIKRDGSELRTLIRSQYTPFLSEGNTRIANNQLDPNHELLTTLDGNGDDVIIGEYRFAQTGDLESINPKRLNTATGRTSALAIGAPDHVKGWLFDRDGNPRVALKGFEGVAEIFWRPERDRPWTSIVKTPYLEGRLSPVALDASNRLYVLAAASSGYSVLKRLDVDTGKPEADALVSTPGFDLSPTLHFARGTDRLLGVGYSTDAAGTVWFDPEYKALQAKLDARFPGKVNAIECRQCLGSTVLVYSYSDQDPGTYYLYTPANDAWTTIGRRREAVVPSQMAQLDFHRTKARDGEDLPIWVTTPTTKSDKPRPAVVLVHGGPWLRGTYWAWDGEAQFLASRGYVVIEPEFRDSQGYGRRHYVKGFKQWGLAMEDDLVDAVRWATDKGIIDPKRVCVMGASYGGYATLMALVRDPDVFKCGVSWLAVTDMRALYDYNWQVDTSREQLSTLPAMVGDPVNDAELLREASPVEHAKKIRAPVLMAFGTDDQRVPLKHGTKMRDALRDAGQNPEFVTYDGEGHGFLKVDNKVDFYTRVEKFLARNLQ